MCLLTYFIEENYRKVANTNPTTMVIREHLTPRLVAPESSVVVPSSAVVVPEPASVVVSVPASVVDPEPASVVVSALVALIVGSAVVGSAVVVGIIFVQLIKRFKIKSFYGEAIEFQDKDKSIARYLIGGLIFGLGWALAGACPGPMFTLLGAGYLPILVVIVSAVLGTYLYGLLKDKLPH